MARIWTDEYGQWRKRHDAVLQEMSRWADILGNIDAARSRLTTGSWVTKSHLTAAYDLVRQRHNETRVRLDLCLADEPPMFAKEDAS